MTIKDWLIAIPLAIISVLMIAGAWVQNIDVKYSAMINNLIHKMTSIFKKRFKMNKLAIKWVLIGFTIVTLCGGWFIVECTSQTFPQQPQLESYQPRIQPVPRDHNEFLQQQEQDFQDQQNVRERNKIRQEQYQREVERYNEEKWEVN